MGQNIVHRACGRIGLLGALAFAGTALVVSPVAEARGGGNRGGGSSHAGGGNHVSGGGSHFSGGGNHVSGGGSHFSGSTYSRGSGIRGSSGHGTVTGGGWVTHSGARFQSSGPRVVSGRPAPTRGGRSWGRGYGGYGGYGGWYRSYRPIYWGWYDWGWGWGWGWAPYWSTWWWGGPWGGASIYVAPGSVDVGARGGRYAVVKTDVSPEEAQVYLDGKYIGTADDFDGTPDFLYLGPGTYHLEFRLPNYQTYATDVEVTRGQQLRIQQELKLEPGKSALDAFPPESRGTPLGRAFTKGGDAAQAAPRGDDGWSDREPPPAYRDREAPPAYRERERERPDEERMDARPEPPPRPSNRGRIKFKVTPDDAAVYMDDKYLGAADDLEANPRGVVAEPGTHTITVTRPGYKSKTVEVTARAGSPVDVVVELEK
jgi:hypothetical protein